MFFFCHIPSAASKPGTTVVLCSFQLSIYNVDRFNPLWAMNTTIFSRNIKPVPHFRANNCTTLAKKRSLRSSFIDPYRFAKKRCNTSQGFGALNSCVDWSEGFPNMVLRKVNIYEHRTRVTRFNSL